MRRSIITGNRFSGFGEKPGSKIMLPLDESIMVSMFSISLEIPFFNLSIDLVKSFKRFDLGPASLCIRL